MSNKLRRCKTTWDFRDEMMIMGKMSSVDAKLRFTSVGSKTNDELLFVENLLHA